MKVVVRTSTYPLHLDGTSKIHHVFSVENVSFDPYPVTPCSSGSRESHHRLVHRCLTFSSSEEDDDVIPADVTPSPWQYTTKAAPCRHLPTTTFQVHPECICYPRNRRRRKRKRTSKQSQSMMNIGIWKKSLTDIYAFMNIHYQMDCVHI